MNLRHSARLLRTCLLYTSGEVRAVSQAGQRVSEAAKLGFTSCVLPKVCADKMKPVEGIKIIGVANVREAIGVI